MDVNAEIRQQQLENLQEFITFSKSKVQIILEKIGWEPEKVLEDNSLITCSLDTAHKISQKRADQHIEKCSLRKGGYNLNEQFLSEPINDPKSSVLIDDYKKIEILSEYRKMNKDYKPGWNGQDPDPKTADRLTSTYSTQERLALYDYSVTATNGPPHLPDYDIINLKSDSSKPLTYEEQRAQERDAKRRRIKYKAIHTTHKSHTEVLRELIEGQMDLYKDWLDHNDTKKDSNNDLTSEREHSIASRNSTHSDNSRKEKDGYKSRSRRSSDQEKDRYHERLKSASRKYDKYKNYKDDERRREDRERSPSRQSRYSYSRKRRSRERQRSLDRNHSDYKS